MQKGVAKDKPTYACAPSGESEARVLFRVVSEDKLYEYLSSQDFFCYSLVNGVKSREKSGEYVLQKDGYYFYLTVGNWYEEDVVWGALQRMSLKCLAYENGNCIAEGMVPVPFYAESFLIPSRMEKRENGYFCSWANTVGLHNFGDVVSFYSGPNGEFVKVEEEEQKLIFRVRSPKNASGTKGGDWSQDIGELKVTEDGILICPYEFNRIEGEWN